MRRWRIIILLCVVLPIYIWLLMAVGIIAAFTLVEPGEFGASELLDLVTPSFWIDEIFGRDSWGWWMLLLPACVLAATQIAFILPVFGIGLRSGRGARRSLWWTVIAAGAVGGFLTFGLLYAFGELFQLWEDGEAWPVEWIERSPSPLDEDVRFGLVIWAQIIAGWLIWSVILGMLARRGDPRRFHNRLLMGLLGGTILEVLIVVPIDVIVRRRTDCYCGTGTFFALCASVWACLWLAGPGMILALTSKRRRTWGRTHCLNCGYQKGPSPGERCPECGYEWGCADEKPLVRSMGRIFMRHWRTAILLGVLMPIYIWLLMIVGYLAAFLVAFPGDVDQDKLLELVNPWFWIDEILGRNLGGSWFLLLPACVLAGTQIAFVLPAFGARLRSGRGARRSLWWTIIAAGAVGGFLTLGLFYAFGELFRLWDDGEPWPVGWIERSPWPISGSAQLGLVIWAQIIFGWLIWSVIIGLLARRGDPKRLHRRLLMWLLGGTILEVLIVVPIDVMVRGRTDFYGGTGTFFALCTSIWACLWLAGPWVILTLTSRRRRTWGQTHCLKCGYEKGPSPGERCPECGYDWRCADK